MRPQCDGASKCSGCHRTGKERQFEDLGIDAKLIVGDEKGNIYLLQTMEQIALCGISCLVPEFISKYPTAWQDHGNQSSGRQRCRPGLQNRKNTGY